MNHIYTELKAVLNAQILRVNRLTLLWKATLTLFYVLLALAIASLALSQLAPYGRAFISTSIAAGSIWFGLQIYAGISLRNAVSPPLIASKLTQASLVDHKHHFSKQEFVLIRNTLQHLEERKANEK